MNPEKGIVVVKRINPDQHRVKADPLQRCGKAAVLTCVKGE